MDPNEVRAVCQRLRDQLLIALFSRGHCLFVGVPGLAKTLLISTLAEALSLTFNRIQFTPDLMPSDITGTDVLEEDHTTGRRAFRFVSGPVFAHVLLADEINRTPPKTQAALLQAMQERTVTIDGRTHPLGSSFLVIATQNPIEQEGTYPLPEAQLDRFLFKVVVDYPSRDEEREMVRLHGHRTALPSLAEFGIETVAGPQELQEMRRLVAAIRLSEEVVSYVVDLVRETRRRSQFIAGASPRAANMLATAARAWALLQGRDYVIPDDVKHLAQPTLRHRLVLAPGAEIEGTTTESALRQVLDQVPAPR